MPRFSGKKADTGVPVTIDRDRYTEGDVIPSMEGSIVLGEKPGNTAFPIQIDADGYLQVAIGGGATSGTEYSDNDLNTASKGTLIMGDDGVNVQNISVGANGRLQVEVVAGKYDGVQYQDGAAVGAPFGTVALGHDGANVFPVIVDSNGYLQIQEKKASVFDSMVDVTLVAEATTQIVGEVVTRFCVLIGNFFDNTQTFRIGDASTGASRGAELAPGQSISIETTEAVYGYNPGGSNEAVFVIWTGD